MRLSSYHRMTLEERRVYSRDIVNCPAPTLVRCSLCGVLIEQRDECGHGARCVGSQSPIAPRVVTRARRLAAQGRVGVDWFIRARHWGNYLRGRRR